MADWLQPGSLSYRLIVDPSLDTWANIAEFAGIVISIISLCITVILKTEVNEIKRSFTFDKRVKSHIKNIQSITSELNNLLNSYASNTRAIKTKIELCQVELQDLVWKLDSKQRSKSNKLINFIEKIKNNKFTIAESNLSPFLTKITSFFRRFYSTDISDIWHIHDSCIVILNQLENIRENRRHSL